MCVRGKVLWCFAPDSHHVLARFYIHLTRMFSRLSRNTLAHAAFVLFWPAAAVIVWGALGRPAKRPIFFIRH